MGGGASKKLEPVVKVDGVNEVDNSFSIINIHQTTVAYMSLIVIFIVAIVILVYVYFRRGGLHCCIEAQHHTQHQPPTITRRYISGDPRPGSVVELVRMEDGSDAVMKTFAVGAGKPRQSATLSSLLQPMKGMDDA